MTTQNRMHEGMRLALQATAPDPDNRYQAAMIRRAEAILSRANDEPDPDTVLPAGAATLSKTIREQNSLATDPEMLRLYVMAKLAISNPAYLSQNSLKPSFHTRLGRVKLPETYS